ncbi:hypothetical protein GBAR_LOCUS28056 [Geodia barretti]|uniref:Uncharacterized protein n=1 Tax=Geodia barretti TaxID=519541 RepID=A0AA35TNF4_GEOBA|nr:hypothetical protein GBAR_LOCUS28056 [Geodia barretti]
MDIELQERAGGRRLKRRPEDSSEFLLGFPHRRALIALALFFPTGIFALFYSIKESQHISEGSVEEAQKAAERAEKFIIISNRTGVAVLFTLALSLIAAVVFLICNSIGEAHVGDRF